MLYPSWAAWTDRRRAMFIQDFVQVDRCFDEVRTLIRADPRALLVGNARDAYRDGERFFVRLEPSTDHPTFGKKVQVELAEPYECQDSLVVPMHWWALGATRLFPHLDAVLEFAPLGSTWTQITLMGGYDPPAGVIGRRADALVLHRVAEASIRSFVTRVARGLHAPPWH